MLKSERKKIIQEIVKEIPIERVCDFCKGQIDEKNWFRVETSHNDWGNDSIDSLGFYDACSPKCAIKFAEKYLLSAYKNATNTKEIKIEHMRYLGDFDSDGDTFYLDLD